MQAGIWYGMLYTIILLMNQQEKGSHSISQFRKVSEWKNTPVQSLSPQNATIAEGKGYFDVLSRQLKIPEWKQIAALIEASVGHPKTWDKYILWNGTLQVFRDGKCITSHIIDVEIDRAYKNKNTHKTHIQETTKQATEKCRQEVCASKIVISEKINWNTENRSIQPVATKLANALWISPSIMSSLIERESGFRSDLVSQAGAKGIMQIRDIVFDDMRGKYNQKGQIESGRWMMVYRSFFQKIPRDVIQLCPEITKQWLTQLQSKNEMPRQQYQEIIKVLQLHASNPYVNMIIGSVYLSFLLETVDDNKQIPSLVHQIDLKKLNGFRQAKWQNLITSNQLSHFAHTLQTSENARKKFSTLASYNEWSLTKKWTHGVYYATLIMMA